MREGESLYQWRGARCGATKNLPATDCVGVVAAEDFIGETRAMDFLRRRFGKAKNVS